MNETDADHGDTVAGADDNPWTTILTLNCTFPADIFEQVMLNLIRNPNLTSSFLFRADIFVDTTESRFTDQLQAKYRPRPLEIPEWTLERTIVRELIPRNIQLDKSLVQTCLFFRREHEHQIVYIPHIDNPDEIPYYHPRVRMIAFGFSEGAISLKFDLFEELTDRLQRTGLKLLQTIHKHGQGTLEGYEKKVHHDKLVSQRAYQDTYTRLKVKYAKTLVENWVEVTDPGKHVFEDIGIAAFLIELWQGHDVHFVDIGCGNGLLTYLLISEGYAGYGFDARRRKTWAIFPPEVQARLHEQVFVPSVLGGDELPTGAFIISNHADELTAWTPLLASLIDGAFMAIPCCSHDLSGKRFRAPPAVRGQSAVRLPQQASEPFERQPEPTLSDPLDNRSASVTKPPATNAQAVPVSTKTQPETGSLKRTLVQKKMASAYSTLCSYVESLTAHAGFEVETEVLRIPSTRNHAIIGRNLASKDEKRCLADKKATIVKLLEQELGMGVADIAKAWWENADRISKKPGSGH